MKKETLQMWHNLSFNDKVKIELLDDKDIVSCFYCLQHFTADQIIEFTESRYKDTGTALCPNSKCGIDSIVPMEIAEEDLKQMYKFYFC